MCGLWFAWLCSGRELLGARGGSALAGGSTRPEKPTGLGIVVCPGGGHRHLAIEHEGRNVAKYFNKLGVAVFVLKDRLTP